jgi:hypothetical protein
MAEHQFHTLEAQVRFLPRVFFIVVCKVSAIINSPPFITGPYFPTYRQTCRL